MAAKKTGRRTRFLPEFPFIIRLSLFQLLAAIEFCWKAEDSFVEMFGAGKGLRNNGGGTETGQFQKNIKLRKRPRGNMHMGTEFYFVRQRREGGKEAAKQVLQPSLGIPHVGGSDDEGAAGLQAAVKVPQQQQRAADVLEALAAANEVIALAIFGQSLVEVVLPEFPVAGRVIDIEVDPVHGHVVPQRLRKPTAARRRVERGLKRLAAQMF